MPRQSTQIAPPTTLQCQPGTLGGELRIALTRLSRRLRSERGRADLPEGQYSILSTLARMGPMSPGALAEHERVRPPSMTRAVNVLAEIGVVAKQEHPSDRRQVIVELTAAGEREVEETVRRRDAWLTQQLATLTPDERQTLAHATQLLTRIATQ